MGISDLWVVVGLGNPGAAYADTRHNIGFRVADGLVREWGGQPWTFDGPGDAYRAQVGGASVYVLKPSTYMNKSGEALAAFPPSEEAGPGNHLIVYDDIALPFGTLRFRLRGGSGGHNGLSSVLAALGTQEVPRLRLGIGPEDGTDMLRDFVLSPFTAEEAKAVPRWLDRAVRGVRVFVEESPEASMNQFNQQRPDGSAGNRGES